MSSWGLLGGVGRGLSQFGSTLQQGMSADITAQKQQEAEARRQASIEKRWARQDAKQEARELKADARHAEDRTWREERAKVGDKQNERSMQLRESQSIESNMSGILNAQQKAEADIYKRYEKQSKDPMGMPLQGEALAQLNQAMQSEIQAMRSQYQTMIEQRIASYGDKLRGTGYAYLLDVPDTTGKPDPTTGDNNLPSAEKSDREKMYEKILTGNYTPDTTSDVTETNDSIDFGDPRAKDINAFQSIGRAIGNILPVTPITDEQMNNSSSGGLLMPRKSLVQRN